VRFMRGDGAYLPGGSPVEEWTELQPGPRRIQGLYGRETGCGDQKTGDVFSNKQLGESYRPQRQWILTWKKTSLLHDGSVVQPRGGGVQISIFHRDWGLKDAFFRATNMFTCPFPTVNVSVVIAMAGCNQ
jgi:hypothetical protein